MKKILNKNRKLGITRNIYNLTQGIYQKLTAYIITNGKKLNVFPIRLETRQGCPLLPLLFNIILEILANAIRQKGKKDAYGLERRK